MVKSIPQESPERRQAFSKPWVECSRPFCFRTEDPPYEFGVGGTCFVIRYRARLWAVTAKHVLGILKPSQAAIPYHLGSDRYLPIANAFGRDDYPTDSEITDFAVFEIDMEHLDLQHFVESTVYDLDTEEGDVPTEGMLVAIHGFPTRRNQEMNDGGLILERDSIAGHLITTSPWTGCWQIQLGSDAGLDTHDGFSGAPVFVASEEFDQTARPKLLGVNTRGSAQKKVKTFIHVMAVRALIDYHLTRA